MNLVRYVQILVEATSRGPSYSFSNSIQNERACIYAILSQKEILYYKIQSVCVSVCVSEYVSMLVRNRLPNHKYYVDEAFAGDSVGLGLGQRLNFISKNCSKVLLEQNRP